ncbi:phosphate ABC transporter substrate-binding protein PstS [Parendozoicomonas haliclonae]|uniref:Phosphate-binding protein PstS n=1 Tax=Parendozoicomonas haliclonae TaxID=1960125 RepID=A0A1X7AMT1_9GAMM|nr:phosphate ABC transporter substrate-binding protein PstS [Parendozoicomonas haliclonae]SMA49591.1 Phosphate-binding protein PstS precursor [Parendozoicomonas haliclonae]
MKLLKSVFVSSVMLAASAFALANNDTINGAGSTFAHPLYSKWAEEFRKESGIRVNYQAIGSGGGIRQITAKTVDFGASDAPLTDDKLNREGLIQFPTAMGAIVPVVNIPGVAPGAMKLTGKVLADIYLGNIKKWNDERITALNPGLNIPGQPIYVVHRSDGSGTTFTFTDYLSRVNEQWKNEIGVNTDITWPRKATTIGGNGNAGVASFVRRTRGAIGYVEYAYAKQNSLTHTQLASAEGTFLQPSMETFQAAAANADWANTSNFYLLLNNQPGANSWPITAATFILLHKDQADAAKTKSMLDFFEWSYAQGDQHAIALDYIPMPENVSVMVADSLRQLTVNGQPVSQ